MKALKLPRRDLICTFLRFHYEEQHEESYRHNGIQDNHTYFRQYQVTQANIFLQEVLAF
jgi:hypothetical protein